MYSEDVWIQAAKHLSDVTLPKLVGADQSALRLILDVLAQYREFEHSQPTGKHSG